MKRLKTFLIFVILAANIYGQFPGNPGPPPEENGRRFDRREKIEELRIWKMTSFLDLSTDQAVKFFPLLKEHEEKIFKIIQQHHSEVEKITQKCIQEDYNPTDKELNDLIDAWEKNDIRIKKAQSEFVKKDLDFLTNQQKLKYIIFDSRFKSHLLRALKEQHKNQ
jgi:hypothetical protein